MVGGLTGGGLGVSEGEERGDGGEGEELHLGWF